MQALVDTQIQKYPKLFAYIRKEMPLLASNKKIVDSMVKAAHCPDPRNKTTLGGLRRKLLEEGLPWGKGPYVVVAPHGLSSGGTPLEGAYERNEIRLSGTGSVWDFENGRDPYSLKTGRRMYRVGAVLLHELAHWLHAQNSFTDRRQAEVGSQFELLAYGEYIGAPPSK